MLNFKQCFVLSLSILDLEENDFINCSHLKMNKNMILNVQNEQKKIRFSVNFGLS